MQSPSFNRLGTEAVIASGQLSSVTSFLEAVRLLSCLEGVIRVLADPLMGTVGIVFERSKVDIPMVPTTLELFGFKAKEISKASQRKPNFRAN